MSDAKGPHIPYRCHLVAAIGSTVMLLGLLIYNRLEILPIQVPSQGYGVACIAFGALLIMLSGWLLFKHRLSRWRAQVEQERKH
jgi:hypothetical protein